MIRDTFWDFPNLKCHIPLHKTAFKTYMSGNVKWTSKKVPLSNFILAAKRNILLPTALIKIF